MVAYPRGRQQPASREASEVEDARRDVTICIAGMCLIKPDDPPTAANFRIILCTDRKISAESGSAETMLKQRVLSHGFYCLTSGTDHEIRGLLTEVRRFFTATTPATEGGLITALRAAIAKRKLDKVNAYVQSRFSVTYDEFKEFGKLRFPEDLFKEAMYDISNIAIDVQMVIAGFASDFPLIVEMHSGSEIAVREDFGIAGAGGTLAKSALLQRQYMGVLDYERAAYFIYEAKRNAERHNTVGPQTEIRYISKGGEPQKISIAGMEFLQQSYEKYGLQRLPAKLSMPADSWQNLYRQPAGDASTS